jgi:hypothetical protein
MPHQDIKQDKLNALLLMHLATLHAATAGADMFIGSLATTRLSAA